MHKASHNMKIENLIIFRERVRPLYTPYKKNVHNSRTHRILDQLNYVTTHQRGEGGEKKDLNKFYRLTPYITLFILRTEKDDVLYYYTGVIHISLPLNKPQVP